MQLWVVQRLWDGGMSVLTRVVHPLQPIVREVLTEKRREEERRESKRRKRGRGNQGGGGGGGGGGEIEESEEEEEWGGEGRLWKRRDQGRVKWRRRGEIREGRKHKSFDIQRYYTMREKTQVHITAPMYTREISPPTLVQIRA